MVFFFGDCAFVVCFSSSFYFRLSAQDGISLPLPLKKKERIKDLPLRLFEQCHCRAWFWSNHYKMKMSDHKCAVNIKVPLQFKPMAYTCFLIIIICAHEYNYYCIPLNNHNALSIHSEQVINQLLAKRQSNKHPHELIISLLTFPLQWILF